MTTSLTPDQDGVQAIIDTAQAATEPYEVEVNGHVYGLAHVTPANTQVRYTDLESLLAPHRPTPARKQGTVAAHDAESFAAYFNKHGDAESEVWADMPRTRIVGVINPHRGDGPGWGDHRVVYTVQFTPEWKLWVENNGKAMSQIAFAELIENREVDIIDPTGADMLELVQSFQATANVEFESSQRLSNGEATISYKETIAGKAGNGGRLEFPTEILLALQPFEGSDVVKVKARIRYRIVDKALRMSYALDRPDETVRDAFQTVVDAIDQLVPADSMNGTPA